MSIKYLPLQFVLSFLLFTLFLYNVGPMPWESPNQLLATLFVLLSLGSLAAGYFYGARKTYVSKSIGFNTRKIITIGTALNVATLPLSIYAYTGGGILDVSFNLSLQGQVHRDFYEHITSTGSSPFRLAISLVRAICSPVIFASIILGIRYWTLIPGKYKLIVSLTIISQVVFSFARGTDKELVDLLIIFVAASLFSMRINMLKNVFKYAVISVLMLSFVNIFMDRREARYLHEMPECFSVERVCVDPYGSTFATLVGRANYLGFSSLTNYLTQGYHGMALAMDLPFDSMFGLGHAPALARIFERIVGPNAFFDSAYNRKLTSLGWDERFAWSSLYSWIANDVSFYLVPLVFAFIGYIYAAAWIQARKNNDQSGYIVYVYLTLLLVYSPANNQLAVSLEMYAGWMFWFFWWLFKREKMKTQRTVRRKSETKTPLIN